MYSVNYYSIDQIEQLKKPWERLEKGPDMTYFQTFAWNRMLSEQYKSTGFKLLIEFVVICCDSSPVLIAPFIVIKRTKRIVNKKGIYFFGRKGWSDYLNLVYDEFRPETVDYLFNAMSDKYGIVDYRLEQVKENSNLYFYLKSKSYIAEEISTECVGLDIPETIEDYLQKLSKHARQNLRTAKNRADKDGLTFSYNFDDINVDKKVCQTMRENRVEVKVQKGYNTLNYKQKLLRSITSRLEFKYPDYLPFYSDENSKMLTVYDDDKLCAFFNYGIDRNHNSVVLMAVGTNEEYSRYSPGMLAMFEFIKSNFNNKIIRYIDFTRGNEPYKKCLGGGVS